MAPAAVKSRLVSPPRRRVRTRKPLTPQDWVAAARDMLIRTGVDGVKVDLLAKALKVTRGSFYWHFEDRADLLRSLLADWEQNNTEPMLAAIRAAGARGDRADFDTEIGRFWLEEKDYSPAFDSAMRDWARTDPKVDAAVRRIDDTRIAALAEMFVAYGFEAVEAMVRARVTYYHQVGYYTLAVIETAAEREALAALYDKVLLF